MLIWVVAPIFANEFSTVCHENVFLFNLVKSYGTEDVVGLRTARVDAERISLVISWINKNHRKR